jgi:hypothetical protein
MGFAEARYAAATPAGIDSAGPKSDFEIVRHHTTAAREALSPMAAPSSTSTLSSGNSQNR